MKTVKKSRNWEEGCVVRNKSDIFISTGVSSSVASATGPRSLLISTGRASFRPPQQFSLHRRTNDRPPEREAPIGKKISCRIFGLPRTSFRYVTRRPTTFQYQRSFYKRTYNFFLPMPSRRRLKKKEKRLQARKRIRG